MFIPLTPSGANWNPACFDCRKSMPREPLPDLPLLTCSSCQKTLRLTHFTSQHHGVPAVLDMCSGCRARGGRPPASRKHRRTAR